jgi:hypothetical protein
MNFQIISNSIISRLPERTALAILYSLIIFILLKFNIFRVTIFNLYININDCARSFLREEFGYVINIDSVS